MAVRIGRRDSMLDRDNALSPLDYTVFNALRRPSHSIALLTCQPRHKGQVRSGLGDLCECYGLVQDDDGAPSLPQLLERLDAGLLPEPSIGTGDRI